MVRPYYVDFSGFITQIYVAVLVDGHLVDAFACWDERIPYIVLAVVSVDAEVSPDRVELGSDTADQFFDIIKIHVVPLVFVIYVALRLLLHVNCVEVSTGIGRDLRDLWARHPLISLPNGRVSVMVLVRVAVFIFPDKLLDLVILAGNLVHVMPCGPRSKTERTLMNK